jgi:hypothetical protein
LPIPVLPTVLPVVVPVVGEPIVVPPVVVPLAAELPLLLVDCASASVLVNANAAASPNVASLMGYSLFRE